MVLNDVFVGRITAEIDITQSATIDSAKAVCVPRARGVLDISSKRRDGTSVIADLHQSGSFRMLFPRGRRDALTGVFLNTAGGMTGGDKFAISAHAQAASRLTLTSQAAERIYGAASGTATLSTTLRVDEGARLDWMPQETILFEQSALRRSLDVTVAQGATFLMVEPVVFGRLAMGERVRHGTFVDKVRVRDSDGLLFADQITLNGDLDLVLQGLAVGHGALAMASVLFVAPDAAAHLTTLRYLMPATGGVSLIRDRVLFIRILAADSFVLRQSLLPVLRVLYGADLPKTWML